MNLLFLILAADGLGAENGMTGWMVVLTLVTLTTLAANGFALFRGGKREVSLKDKPLHVNMEDKFVTRREFDGLRADIKVFETKMESLFQRTFDKIEERDKVLSKRVDTVGQRAYEGRHGIHERVNDLRERVASVEKSAEVCPRPPHCDSNTTKTKS